MNWNRLKWSLGLASIYWIPATLVLLVVLEGKQEVFSPWILSMFLPGYIIALLLAFAGGTGGAIVGQLGTLMILTVLMLPFTYFFRIERSTPDDAEQQQR